jgi:hypothetical protein
VTETTTTTDRPAWWSGPLRCAIAGVLFFVAMVWCVSLIGEPAHAQPSGQPLYPVFLSSHITTNATTAILTGAGVVHTVCVNGKGATGNIATVYDSLAASGTVIGILDTTAAVGCLLYDRALTTGLTVVTGTGTAPDLTVTYRALR